MAAPITSWMIRSAFSNNACMTKTSTEANEDNEEGMELQGPPQGPHHQVHHSPSPQKRGRCHQLDCNHSALSNRCAPCRPADSLRFLRLLLFHCSHSYRSASIGSSRLALRAG